MLMRAQLSRIAVLLLASGSAWRRLGTVPKRCRCFTPCSLWLQNANNGQLIKGTEREQGLMKEAQRRRTAKKGQPGKGEVGERESVGFELG